VQMCAEPVKIVKTRWCGRTQNPATMGIGALCTLCSCTPANSTSNVTRSPLSLS
jgi:hypothetical protein